MFMIMSIVSEHRILPKGSLNNRTKLVLVIRCDTCCVLFERDQNTRALKQRSNHFCGKIECFATAISSGGPLDIRRRATCRERYGAEFYITIPEVARQSSKRGQTREARAKQYETRRKNQAKNAITLRNGLMLSRSKQEITFFEMICKHLNIEGTPQCNVNKWWIDVLLPGPFDVYIQFDGVYWHSGAQAVKRDREQDRWFIQEQKILYRITDHEFKKRDFSIKEWCDQRGLFPLMEDNITTSL